jgi:hypothetical protein
METAMVYRVISLIPDRTARAQSGSVFSEAEASSSKHPERFALLARFLHWLGPLDTLTKEDQQFLGLRNGGGRPLGEGDDLEPGEDAESLEDAQLDEQQSIRPTQAGTQVAV